MKKGKNTSGSNLIVSLFYIAGAIFLCMEGVSKSQYILVAIAAAFLAMGVLYLKKYLDEKKK